MDENNPILNEEKPIQLINFEGSKFIINEKALDFINSIQEEIIVVSIIGKARTGKSYLMNLLLDMNITANNTTNISDNNHKNSYNGVKIYILNAHSSLSLMSIRKYTLVQKEFGFGAILGKTKPKLRKFSLLVYELIKNIVDSEGSSSVDRSTKTYDSKIYALIVLISSLFLYNTTTNIDESSINELSLAAHLSNSITSNVNKFLNNK